MEYLKASAWYVLIICLINVTIVATFLIFTIYPIPKSIQFDVVIMKGILFIYIMSMSKVMLPCSSNIPLGSILHLLSITLSGFFFSCLAFSDPKLEPNMFSACTISALVMGQLGIRFFSTYLM